MSKKAPKKGSKSNLTHLHRRKSSDLKNGKIITVEEDVIDGPKSGISFKYFKRDGDKTEKYQAKQNDDGTFTLTIIKDGKVDSQRVSKSDLLKTINKVKELDFAHKYIASTKQARMKLRRASRRKTSKKASGKPRRKASRKSRKTSRKSRKVSSKPRRKSKKTSRKSRKASSKPRRKSKKTSRKSRRRSRK